MEECCTEDIDSMWHYVWPTNIYVGQWPIFCGTLIRPYIFNTIWWASLIGSNMDQWPVFHDLAILNHLPISAYSGLLKLDMKIFVISWRLFDGQIS